MSCSSIAVPASSLPTLQDLSAKAEANSFDLGVEVHTNSHVTASVPAGSKLNDQRIDAAVILWAAGVQASPLGKMLGAPTDKRGCVIVDEQLNPPGLPEVFVLGDLAHFEQDGKQVPGVAQPAYADGRPRRQDDRSRSEHRAPARLPLFR